MSEIVVTTEVKFQVWRAPAFARQVIPAGSKQDGIRETPVTYVGDLSETALLALAQRWLDDLFAQTDFKAPKIGGEA